MKRDKKTKQQERKGEKRSENGKKMQENKNEEDKEKKQAEDTFSTIRQMTHPMPPEVYHSNANKKPCTSMGVSLINANKPKFIMKDKITAAKGGAESRWRRDAKKRAARRSRGPGTRPPPRPFAPPP